jgi:hypothetical protein
MKTNAHSGAGCLRLACWGLFLLGYVAARAQFSDACWTGTWTGTNCYLTACGTNCLWSNCGSITIMISANNGVVTGWGSQDGVSCINCSNCTVTGHGTTSGPLSGTVSGNTIILSNNWVNSCNGQTNSFTLVGTLDTANGCIITGYPDFTMAKVGSCDSCKTNTSSIRWPPYNDTRINQNPIIIVNGPTVMIIDGQHHKITFVHGDPFTGEIRPASAKEVNSVVGRVLKEAAQASPSADWNREANNLAQKLLAP